MKQNYFKPDLSVALESPKEVFYLSIHSETSDDLDNFLEIITQLMVKAITLEDGNLLFNNDPEGFSFGLFCIKRFSEIVRAENDPRKVDIKLVSLGTSEEIYRALLTVLYYYTLLLMLCSEWALNFDFSRAVYAIITIRALALHVQKFKVGLPPKNELENSLVRY